VAKRTTRRKSPRTRKAAPKSISSFTKLPLRAVAAFATRCARRLQPGLIERETDSTDDIELVEKALALAEGFCRGDKTRSSELDDAAVQIERLIDGGDSYRMIDGVDSYRRGEALLAASLAARIVGRAAAGTPEAATEHADRLMTVGLDLRHIPEANTRDLRSLEAAELGKFGNLGKRIDSSEKGPIGDLWGGERPKWYADLKLQLDDVLGNRRSRAVIDDLKAEVDRSKRELQRSRAEFSARSEEHSGELAEADGARRRLQKDLEATRDKLRDVETKVAYETPFSFKTLKERFWNLESLMLGVAICFLVSSVLVTLLAISEIQSRQDFVRILRVGIDRIEEDLTDGHNFSGPPPIWWLVGWLQPDPDGPRSQLDELERIRNEAQLLISTGAEHDCNLLGALRDRLLTECDEDVTKSTGSGSVTCCLNSWIQRLRLVDGWVPYQSSDLLLSIVVILAGTIGSVIASMRQGNVFTGRELVLGLSAGLITFLVIRSGRSVLLLQIDGASYMLNPYTSAFLGLAAGLFTERAFQLMLSVVITLVDKLVAAFDLQTDLLRSPFRFEKGAGKKDIDRTNKELARILGRVLAQRDLSGELLASLLKPDSTGVISLRRQHVGVVSWSSSAFAVS
jgi:hypothetical protein